MSDVEPIDLIPGLGGLVGSVVTTVASAREAEKNRKFQERMSSTAHQREVADLIKAGLNPALSAMRGGGASSPGGSMGQVADFGESAARGINSALALKRQKAEIDLLEAQAAAANAAGQESNARASDLLKTQPGRMSLTAFQAAIASADAERVRGMLPYAIQQAKAEVDRTLSGARQAEAMAVLQELARSGAINEAEFEKSLGQGGPFSKFLLRAVQVMKAAKN